MSDFDPADLQDHPVLPPLKKAKKKPKDPARQKRGRTARKRGKAFEREVVKRLQELGDKDAHRRFGDKPSGDAGTGRGDKLECKSGYGGMKTIRRWLDAGGNYAVVYESLQDKPFEKKPPDLVFMRFEDFAELIGNQKRRTE